MGILNNIKDGWLNYMKDMQLDSDLSKEIKDLADKRAEICKECPELVESGFYKIINRVFSLGHGKSEVRPTVMSTPSLDPSESDKWDGKHYKCNKCGCAFPQNVYASQKECPLKKW